MHAEQPEPAARHCSIAWRALFDPLVRRRYSEVDDPYLEHASKQFYIKMVSANSSRGRRTSHSVKCPLPKITYRRPLGVASPKSGVSCGRAKRVAVIDPYC